MATFTQVKSKGITLRYGNDGFIASSPETLPDLVREKGAGCLMNVLSTDECFTLRNGMLDAMEFLTSGLEVPFNSKNPSTYGSIFALMPNHGGLFQHHKLTHIQSIWDIRQNPNVAAAHAAFHKCDINDLLVSFDGVNFSPGALIPGRKRGQFRGNCWLHTDQRPSNSTEMCMQSWVTANDIGVGDATLRFLEGSHLLHGAFAKAFNLTNTHADWFKMAPEHITWFENQGCKDTCITVPAGSQVFWDSRTVHSGIEFIDEADCPPRELSRSIRMVVYVCYEPRTGPVLPESHPDIGKTLKGLPKILAKRKRIMDPNDQLFLRTTSHWPNKMKLFPKTPRSYTNTPPTGCKQTDPAKYWSFVPDISTPPVLTEFGRCIAGIN